jgi:hypothetical protein
MSVPYGVAKEILEEMEKMSGVMLWHVKMTWAHRGRTGKQSSIVAAETAIQAVQVAWESEDDRDLRAVSVEWLAPVECVLYQTRVS